MRATQPKTDKLLRKRFGEHYVMVMRLARAGAERLRVDIEQALPSGLLIGNDGDSIAWLARMQAREIGDCGPWVPDAPDRAPFKLIAIPA